MSGVQPPAPGQDHPDEALRFQTREVLREDTLHQERTQRLYLSSGLCIYSEMKEAQLERFDLL